MIIHFWDKTTLTVSKEQWENIKKLRDRGIKWIELKSPAAEFDPKTIAKVTGGGYTEADVVKAKDRLLQSDNRSNAEQFRAARKSADSVRAVLEKKGILKPKGGKANG